MRARKRDKKLAQAVMEGQVQNLLEGQQAGDPGKSCSLGPEAVC